MELATNSRCPFHRRVRLYLVTLAFGKRLELGTFAKSLFLRSRAVSQGYLIFVTLLGLYQS